MFVQCTLDGEQHIAVNQCEQSVILANADIGSGVELGAALTNNDRAGADQFTTEFFNTEHFGLGIAPISRRAAAFFLCHDSYLLSNNRADQQFSELLTMPLTFLVVLATTHFENANFVVLAVSQNCDTHSCAGHQGSSNFQICAVADCQNFIENNLLAYVRSNLFYFNFFAGSNSVLLAAGFYDRVHDDLFSFALGTNFRRARYYSAAVIFQQT